MGKKAVPASPPLAPDASLIAHILAHRFLIQPDGGIATADMSAENTAWLRAHHPGATIMALSKMEFLDGVERRFGAILADRAAHQLARSMPSLSAHTVITRRQIAAFVLAGASLTAAMLLWPAIAWHSLVVILTIGFLGGTLFRAVLACLGGAATQDAATDAPLPIYTILVPLYREANVLPRLARALLLLDYPRDRLDIKIIVEADDEETTAIALQLADRGPFDVIRVPDGRPRTKPRACNYALAFARGEFTVIYDAEDRPERDQLRKAAAAFRARDPGIACLQARLNFYNADENWLTRGIMAQTPEG